MAEWHRQAAAIPVNQRLAVDMQFINTATNIAAEGYGTTAAPLPSVDAPMLVPLLLQILFLLLVFVPLCVWLWQRRNR